MRPAVILWKRLLFLTMEFSGKLGTKVASEKVTLIDDGSIRDGWGSGYIDDEGELTRKNVLIKDGILKNYLVDRLNGKKLGLSANGSSRRESYRFAPTLILHRAVMT